MRRSFAWQIAAAFSYVGDHLQGEADTLDDSDARTRAIFEAQGHEVLRRDLERAVRRVCPRSLAEEAEDLVQEAFIRLLRARKFDSKDAVSAAYLKKVAYSAVVDEIRRRRRRPVTDSVPDYMDVEAAPDETRTAA